MTIEMNCPPHRYRISEPDGGKTCVGVCRGCGAEREYWAGEQEMADRVLTTRGAMHVHRTAKPRGWEAHL